MATVSITELTTNQTNVNATQFNNLVVPLLNEFNGSIDNANIKTTANIAWTKVNTTNQITNADVNSSAAIVDTKLATIATAGKVSGAALTSLSSIPAGAGQIPAANMTNAMPSGAIVLWSGAISAIPSGWVICDGNNGTPNLTGRFVVHADSDSGGTYDVDETGGVDTNTLAEANIPQHGHTMNHQHTMLYSTGPESGVNSFSGAVIDEGNNTTTLGTSTYIQAYTGSTGNYGTASPTALNNRPKYYALAYIMKT